MQIIDIAVNRISARHQETRLSPGALTVKRLGGQTGCTGESSNIQRDAASHSNNQVESDHLRTMVEDRGFLGFSRLWVRQTCGPAGGRIVKRQWSGSIGTVRSAEHLAR